MAERRGRVAWVEVGLVPANGFWGEDAQREGRAGLPILRGDSAGCSTVAGGAARLANGGSDRWGFGEVSALGRGYTRFCLVLSLTVVARAP